MIAEVGAGLARARGRDRARRRGVRRRARARRHPGALPRTGPRRQRDDRDRLACRRARRLHRGRVHAEHRSAARRRRGRAIGARTRPRGRPVRRAARRAASRKGRQGEELAPIGELYDLGVRVFTDDGDCVADALVMRHAFEYAAALPGAVLAQHAEDPALVRGGHMHEGRVVGAARDPRPARGGGVDDRRPRPAARAAHRRALPRAAPVVRGVGRARARGQGRRRARHRRVHAAAPRAHRRGVRAASTRRSR